MTDQDVIDQDAQESNPGASPKDDLVERCASAAYEVVRNFSGVVDLDLPPPWHKLDALHKRTARHMVSAAIFVGMSASECHEIWRGEMLSGGWDWGLEEDSGRRLHPAILPFHRLSVAQRAATEIFCAAAYAVFDTEGNR